MIRKTTAQPNMFHLLESESYLQSVSRACACVFAHRDLAPILTIRPGRKHHLVGRCIKGREKFFDQSTFDGAGFARCN